MSGLTPTRQAALQEVAGGGIEYRDRHFREGWAYMNGLKKCRQESMHWLDRHGYIKHEIVRKYSVDRIVLTDKGRAAL